MRRGRRAGRAGESEEVVIVIVWEGKVAALAFFSFPRFLSLSLLLM